MTGVFILVLIAVAAWQLIELGRASRRVGASAARKNAYRRIAMILLPALFIGAVAAQLWPLALMLLIAGGGVAMIEFWKDRQTSATDPDTGFGSSPPPARTGAMSPGEAREILELKAGASRDEIHAAHKRLIVRMHPDQGGSTYLAAKVNAARDTLLALAPDEQAG